MRREHSRKLLREESGRCTIVVRPFEFRCDGKLKLIGNVFLTNFIHRGCDNPGIPCKESLLRGNHFCETMAPLDRMLQKITKKLYRH